MNSVAGNLGDWEEHLRESPHSPFNWIKRLLGIAEPAKEGGGVLGGIIDVIPKTSIRETFSAMPSLGGAYPIEQTISKEPSVSERLSPDARNLVANLDFGSTLKNGFASEGARHSLTNTVAAATNVGYEPVNISVADNNFSPAATPNPRFGQQQQQTGMAMG